MSKKITWICDECGNKATNFVIPAGWLEASFYANEKFYRYCFCSYSCLVNWAEKRRSHYGNRFADNNKEAIERVCYSPSSGQY